MTHETALPDILVSRGFSVCLRGFSAIDRYLGREDLPFLFADTGAVCYLVKNHMLPAALPRLPLRRVEEVITSPLFPVLLELYRCDESSSFKGLDGYYESSATYQSYLKYRWNPYRSADEKKMGKTPAKR
ncbi:MAG: hypothetical protein LBQ55_01990 [Treponema sp.]|nr:hypothetical protein [Treponema sp.]